ncbi:MAG: hypothetical protein QOK30_755 [Nocardioidaceae bacterium]|nr:hypothetical protein [Nocardioidaceae bacterium]
MRPSGPLPSRVYWVRRLLVFGVVLLVVAVAWRLLSSNGAATQTSGSQPDAALSGVGGSATSSVASPPTATGTSSPPAAHHKPSHRLSQHRHGSPALPAAKSSAPAAPTGTCDPSDIGIAVSAQDANVGQGTVATLALTTLDGAVCVLQITPSSMVLRITSGGAVVWTSDDCPNLLPARQIVVRPDPATSYRWRWDGRRSVQGCVSAGTVATRGHYALQAALVGAGIYQGTFDITR